MFGLNPWLILGIGMAFIGWSVFIGGAAYSAGADKELLKCNQQKQEAIDANIEIRKEQDAVIRPSNAAYIDSLRRGTF